MLTAKLTPVQRWNWCSLSPPFFFSLSFFLSLFLLHYPPYYGWPVSIRSAVFFAPSIFLNLYFFIIILSCCVFCSPTLPLLHCLVGWGRSLSRSVGRFVNIDCMIQIDFSPQ
ncbi:hypothetical protein HOY80DRAFT_961286 [Tuber brumale]|nr:hypothetical protein HOY80DRAFT_961286 [Tuber brumale]